MSDITLLVAFIAGIVSFLSPCVFPLIPAYLVFLAGTSLKDAEENTKGTRFRIFLASVFFVLGFSIVFSVIGVLLQGVLAPIAYGLKNWLGYIGGVIIILFGLMLVGLIKGS